MTSQLEAALTTEPKGQFSPDLTKKLKAVSKSNHFVLRILTDEEALEVINSSIWSAGWFIFNGAQLVIKHRVSGEAVLFSIGPVNTKIS